MCKRGRMSPIDSSGALYDVQIPRDALTGTHYGAGAYGSRTMPLGQELHLKV
jgi:hypothetical protein